MINIHDHNTNLFMKPEIKGTEIEDWFKWLDEQPRRTEISENAAVELITLLMSNKKNHLDKKLSKMLNETDERGYLKNSESIGYIRFASLSKSLGLDIEMTPTAWMAATLMISDLRPGYQVMLSSYLVWKSIEMGLKKLELEHIPKIFPIGGFSESTLKEAWSKQKDSCNANGNMLDDIRYFKSLSKRG